MKRTLITGGQVFDGSGAAPVTADVVIEGDRIVALGSGLDGDEAVDATGQTVVPGLFDCHTHVMMSGVDVLKSLSRPFSLPFFEAVGNLRTTVECGITSVRDAGGADLGVAEAVRRGLVLGPRIQISISPLSQTGGHGDGWLACGGIPQSHPPGCAVRHHRRAGRGAEEDPRGDPSGRRRHQDNDVRRRTVAPGRPAPRSLSRR